MMQSKKIAITGGIGSGKSTVSKIIQEQGYPVFSCDAIYKELQEEKEYLSILQNNFGEGVVKEGKLDKKLLSSIVFTDKDKLARLNEIAHPMILQRLNKHLEGYAVAFAEVPLLFECGYQNNFDEIIVVFRDREARIAAVCERDGLDCDSVEARIKNQVDHADFLKKEHTVIYNDGDLSSLKEKVLQALEKILN